MEQTGKFKNLITSMDTPYVHRMQYSYSQCVKIGGAQAQQLQADTSPIPMAKSSSRRTNGATC